MSLSRVIGSAERPRDARRDLSDEALVRALRAGDERAFARLVEQWSGTMLRLALAHVHNRAVAEEIAQEAWLTVIRSLDRFAFRSTLRTWVLGIVVNLARSRARIERRSVPLDESAVDPARFLPPDHPRWPGHWAAPPLPWPTPEEELAAAETREAILAALEELPPAQREVVMLRDLEGLAAAEVCGVLGITDANQRVLLHRGRSRVRRALECYFDERKDSR